MHDWIGQLLELMARPGSSQSSTPELVAREPRFRDALRGVRRTCSSAHAEAASVCVSAGRSLQAHVPSSVVCALTPLVQGGCGDRPLDRRIPHRLIAGAEATRQSRPVPAAIDCWSPRPNRNARSSVFRWTTILTTMPHPGALRSQTEPPFHRGSVRIIPCTSRLPEGARASGSWSVNSQLSCGVTRPRKSSERPRSHPMDTASRCRPESTDSRFSPWGADGRSITSAADDRGTPRLLKVPLDGSKPTVLVQEYSTDPVWSADGTEVVYSGPDIRCDGGDEYGRGHIREIDRAVQKAGGAGTPDASPLGFTLPRSAVKIFPTKFVAHPTRPTIRGDLHRLFIISGPALFRGACGDPPPLSPRRPIRRW